MNKEENKEENKEKSKEENKHENSLNKLPKGLLEYICNKLDCISFISFCKAYPRIDTYPDLWKRRCQQDFPNFKCEDIHTYKILYGHTFNYTELFCNIIQDQFRQFGKAFVKYGLKKSYNIFLTTYVFNKLKDTFHQPLDDYIDNFIIDDNIPYNEDEFTYESLAKIVEKYYLSVVVLNIDT